MAALLLMALQNSSVSWASGVSSSFQNWAGKHLFFCQKTFSLLSSLCFLFASCRICSCLSNCSSFRHFLNSFCDLLHRCRRSVLVTASMAENLLELSFDVFISHSSSFEVENQGFGSLRSRLGVITLLARGLPPFPLNVVNILDHSHHLLHHSSVFSE